MAHQIPLPGVKMGGKTVPAPFVVRSQGGIRGVESSADAGFRNALLAFAPQEPRRLILEALHNGPKGDGGRHALRYFGEERIKEVIALVGPLTDAIEIAFATKLGRPGFKRWLELTDFGNDYRMIKGFVAWAEMKKAGDDARTGENDESQASA